MRRLVATLALVPAMACDKAPATAQRGEEAARGVASAAFDGAKRAADDAFEDIEPDGTLSDSARAWLETRAKAGGEGSVEHYLHQGAQVAPAATEIAGALDDAIDKDTEIEPIYQKVGDGEADDVDRAIGDMPRVEVIDGVTVGFRQLDELSVERSVKERSFLVLWRHDDALVGFVYRSRQEIDLDALVKAAPRLISLTGKALDD